MQLYRAFKEKLFLINEFGNVEDPVIQITKQNSHFLSTEPPLYSFARAQRYHYSHKYPLSQHDIKYLYRIMPNAVAQSKRLRLLNPSYDIYILCLELYQFWKGYILENDISHYICAKIPHQLSDYLLYEVSNIYCLATRWIYPFSGGLDLHYSGCFGHNLKILEPPTRYTNTLQVHEKLSTFSRKTHELLDLCEFNPYTNVNSWLAGSYTKDYIHNLPNISWEDYISRFGQNMNISEYYQTLESALSASTYTKPIDQSHIFLMSVDPEAVLFPLSAPLLGNLQTLSFLRMNIPLDQPIYIKDHPLAFIPNHRTHVNSQEQIGCIVHRGSSFFDVLQELPNVFYLPPMRSSTWLHNGSYYIYCASSSFVFESLCLQRSINVTTPLSAALRPYSNLINVFPENPPVLNTANQIYSDTHHQRIASLPWFDRLDTMTSEQLLEFINI